MAELLLLLIIHTNIINILSYYCVDVVINFFVGIFLILLFLILLLYFLKFEINKFIITSIV